MASEKSVNIVYAAHEKDIGDRYKYKPIIHLEQYQVFVNW